MPQYCKLLPRPRPLSRAALPSSLKLVDFPCLVVSMSSSNPGPVRRFFRGVWRVVDVSRRVVLNLLFMIIVIAVIIAFARSGPLPLADKTTRPRPAH